MKKIWNGLLPVLVLLCLGAATVNSIKLFSSYPNSVPIGSDFFVLQRNNDFINASDSQIKQDWFNNPVFTGSGGIQGNWRVDSFASIGGYLSIGGIYYGNGAGLTNVPGISGNFFAATNGVGQNPTFYGGGNFFGVYYFDEVDAKNFFPTNLFTGLTNAILLSTDGNGLLVATDFTAATNNDIKISNAATNEVTRQVNSTTNKMVGIYLYSTNIVGAANFVFGKAYWTNITGNFTFPALTMQDNASMETLSVWVTNSGASVFTATINGVAGAPGHVVPAVFYCTNATVTEIDVSHFGVLWTNACVSKN